MTNLNDMGAGEPVQVITLHANGGLLGTLVMDSAGAGTAHGGLRIANPPSEATLRVLARRMTLKYGLLGLPHRGAKAAVAGDPEAPRADRLARLAAFGRAIAPLLRRRDYVPAPDVGTDQAAIHHLLQAVGIRPGWRERAPLTSGEYTAASVVSAARQALALDAGRLRGRTAAVVGVGKVGGPLVSRLAAEGVRIVAVSSSMGGLHDPRGLDVPRLLQLVDAHGSRGLIHYKGAGSLQREEIYRLPADLLFPCALEHAVDVRTAATIRAALVCPGANAPLTDEAETLLDGRGVFCVPDFVANCGGVLGASMAYAGIPSRRIERFVAEDYGNAVGRLLAGARRSGVSPATHAVAEALGRSAATRQCRRSGATALLFRWALGLYRRGALPPALCAPLALPYFRRRVAFIGAPPPPANRRQS